MVIAIGLRVLAGALLTAVAVMRSTEGGEDGIRSALWGIAAGIWLSVVLVDKGTSPESES